MPFGRVIHNTPEKGVHISSVDEFSGGKKVSVVKQKANNRIKAIVKAIFVYFEKKPYNMFKNNCEHTASKILHDKAESPQLRGWIFSLCLVAGICFLLSKHEKQCSG
jgi:hypothetical protein